MSREVGIPSIPLEPPHCCFGNERDFQPSGMSKREPKQEVTAMVPVTNARFNHRECPSVSSRKKSPQWFKKRTLQPSGMSKRERTQEVTAMISVTNGTFKHRECPSVRARKKSLHLFWSRTRLTSIGNVQA